MFILLSLLLYFALIMVVSRLASPHGAGNASFYRGGRRSPWWAVAFGMVGASVSGVTFVGVPGMVLHAQMTYLQMCLGFIVGYFVVAFVLLPLYYRLDLTTIYTLLERRVGRRARTVGAAFFLLSKLTGAALKFSVVCFVLHRFVCGPLGVPFAVTAAGCVLMIWLYTRRGGIATLVWTDTVQTACMLAAAVLILIAVLRALGMTPTEAAHAVAESPMSRVFVFDDWASPQCFWKQFASGVFVVIVMTGLDQDMMQKHLTCRTLRAAQKDVCSYGFAFVPVNLLFLALGVLLVLLSTREGASLPASGDELLTMYAATGRLGAVAAVCFCLGVASASFSTADSALTATTTCCCVDLLHRPDDTRLRRRVHTAAAVLFFLFIVAAHSLAGSGLLDAVYTLCAYTYGPLLGLFAYALCRRGKGPEGRADRVSPYVCVAAPLLCLAIDKGAAAWLDYRFGYELLMLNGLLTFAGLWLAKLGGRH